MLPAHGFLALATVTLSSLCRQRMWPSEVTSSPYWELNPDLLLTKQMLDLRAVGAYLEPAKGVEPFWSCLQSECAHHEC